MKINSNFINEYKKLVKSTNLQKGYQEFIKFFKGLRSYLSGNMTEYKFTANIVENNMNYSYFQFIGSKLQSKKLKFVVVFIHNIFEYEIWLSGMNRKTQINYHTKLSNIKHDYIMSPDPNRFDYILKCKLFDEVNYDNCEVIFDNARKNIILFINKVTELVDLA
jgi:hypothetical protein